jgi:hypothetical protein
MARAEFEDVSASDVYSVGSVNTLQHAGRRGRRQSDVVCGELTTICFSLI